MTYGQWAAGYGQRATFRLTFSWSYWRMRLVRYCAGPKVAWMKRSRLPRSSMRASAPRSWFACAALALAVAAGLSAGFPVTPAQAQFDFPFFGQQRRSQPQPQYQRPDPYRQQRRQQQQGWGGGGGGFFDFGGGGGGNQWGSDPNQYEPRRAPVVDSSKAPPARKLETQPPTSVVVLGDNMADWLAYGLEDAFADTGDIGVVRKHKAGSSLLKSEARDAHDWVTGARDALANEKADFVVMMLGLSDRHAIRERQAPRAATPAKPGETPKPGETAKPGEAQKPADAAKPLDLAKPGDVQKPAEAKPADPSKPADPADAEQPPQQAAAAPEAAPTGRPGALVTHEFRSEKWVELYSKRIDETIAAMKAKRVPVIWVGLPPVRGTRSRSDTTFLNDLYKDRAEKAGIVYVDVWEGFIEESGEFSQYGPDVLGQVRRLRSGDGVYFTKAGARKLAHFVEREIRRLMNRTLPVALPMPDESLPKPGAPAPSGPAARPVAGPIVPLTGHAPVAEGLAGGGRQGDPGVSDPVALKVLVKGEAVPAPKGRADDFVWPRPAAAVAEQDFVPEPAVAAQPVQQPQQPQQQRRGATVRRPGQRTEAAPAQQTATPARAVR